MSFRKIKLNKQNVLLLILIAQASFVVAGIQGSKHDLSVAWGTNEICVFCHTPHNANNDLDLDGVDDSTQPNGRPNAPLWNRRITKTNNTDPGTFTPYTSPTMNTTCDATPSPLSLACLSCHDAAIGSTPGDPYGGGAVSVTDTHQLINEPNLMGPSTPNCYRCHPDGGLFPNEWWQIGPDLSNDHPISMSYPSPAEDPDFNVPSSAQDGWIDIRLFGGRVECPTCHNPHDPTNVPFLRKTIDNSTLCITCHVK